MSVFWEAYVGNILKSSLAEQILTRPRYTRQLLGLDLGGIEVAKYVTEAIRLAIPGKLDKEEEVVTVKIIRNKMRRLFL